MAVVRAGAPRFPGSTDQEYDAVEMVTAHVLSFEQGVGSDWRDLCNKRYQQYRGFSKFRSAWVQAGPNDRDGLLLDAKNTWGAQLHIPLSFRTIETMVPRAVAHRPKMLVIPRQQKWEENVYPVRLLIDAQQEKNDIDLPFQAVMRSGRIYGLGVGKVMWREEYAAARSVRSRTFRKDSFYLSKAQQKCVYNDPFFEDIDVYDFMWDPFGSDMRTCEWVVHRNWASLEGVMKRIAVGAWDTPSAQRLNEETLRRMGGRAKYDEIWQERMEASGFGSHQTAVTERGEQLHEVWEWHDGNRVITVLDREVLVQDAENACLGHKPFQIYRPTPLQKQLVGIGDLEPLEHLQRELDTLRSQRRDAATLALAAGYAYDANAVDEEDISFGPHAMIEVRNASPRDAIMPLQRQEVPGTAYQDEQVLRNDFDVVSGISDALNPQQGQTGTATEAQLVQASLSARIELGSRRFEIEVVRAAARCFLALDQRMIMAPREDLRVPEEGMSYEQAAEEGRWQWFEINPSTLRGEFEVIPEGGSMAARNIPQDRQDAIQMMNVFGQHPNVDPRRPLLKALSLFGVDDPESWLRQQAPPVPQAALQLLQNAGVDPNLIQMAVSQAQRADPMLPTDEGPNVQQVDQAMAA